MYFSEFFMVYFDKVKPLDASIESHRDTRCQVDRSQWLDDDETLSSWSDVTQSEDEIDEDGKNVTDNSHDPPSTFRLPNRPRPMKTADWDAYNELLDKTWTCDEEPPWVKHDFRKGLSDVRPIPNNKTHSSWVEFERRKNDGFGTTGYKLTHERQILHWICQFGQGPPFGNDMLFTWNDDQDQYKMDDKLTLTNCVPGMVQQLIEPFRIMATKLRIGISLLHVVSFYN